MPSILNNTLRLIIIIFSVLPSAVKALLAVYKKLKDPHKNLNWTKKHDPCNSNWMGVICYDTVHETDGYYHVRELYVLLCFFMACASCGKNPIFTSFRE